MNLVFELPVSVDDEGSRPSTHAIYEALKSAILSGRLGAGTKLPPTRSAGQHFRLSRNTMVSIYERLSNESLVVSKRGSGTFVAEAARQNSSPTSQTLERPDAAEAVAPIWADAAQTGRIRFWLDEQPRVSPPDQLELRPALVDLGLFPLTSFRRSMVKALRAMERSPTTRRGAQSHQGSTSLRRAIVDHATLMRTLVCAPDDIIITSGAQQAFDLLARVFIEPGRTLVAVEEPCYPPLVAAFAAAGAVICPVPVDDQGMMVERIPSAAKLVCVCPSNQFPLGITMSAARRSQLFELAEARGLLIVEDDYDGEFRTEGRPLKAIYSEQESDFVMYVGTFSKCMFPSLRLGYLIAPQWAIEPLMLAKNCSDWATSTVIQEAAACFIEEGHLSAHIARMRAAYRGRRAALSDAIREAFGDTLQPIASSYGMHMSARGDPSINWDAVALHGRTQGVQLHSLTRYYEGKSDPGLLFGVGIETEERLRLAVEKLSTFL